ncbi:MULTISPECIES: bacteriophage Gp15 family protein [Terrisporobacter]|uniref:Bacteriophage Gp15 family protein n=1 Tax=Terrisporobacter muris TaxID=2963284 RepID=A0A9X2S289_9FIRM|nr:MULTISPECIES: bacteriophage Gp15 family protein [Terrisporobacter]MCR1821807.1 bacteriophage Gp15 family protein [Terrisporobacter muris]MDU6984236.1 bacteriophage Gp15 family protein [Terrisporobacter othiniensis]MDY3372356.1 bacteriophage Gp15 family protein [Terrisporobacter othiniensis]
MKAQIKIIIFVKRKEENKWYDLFEDWELIEASFLTQYGIRLRLVDDMSWNEFCTLLSGIMTKTPLGQIVSIRAEEDKDILNNFTEDQHKIRNEWRNRNNTTIEMTDEEKAQKIKEFEQMMASMFG